MKRSFWFFWLLLLAFSPVTLLAHKPLLMVDDNGDGTIYIETGFSDGSSGSGHTIRLIEASTGKVLEERKIPAESSLDMKKPSVAYNVVFDAGEGHIVEMPGPPPSTGTSVAPPQPSENPSTKGASPVSSAAKVETAVEKAEPAVAPVTAVAPKPPVQDAPLPMGAGFSAAYRMMVASQIFISVGVFLIFGALMFMIGQRWERSRQKRP